MNKKGGIEREREKGRRSVVMCTLMFLSVFDKTTDV